MTHARLFSAIAAAAVLTIATGAARADDHLTVDSHGEAQGTGDVARTAALDRAFARAVSQAITTIVPRAAATRHRRVLVEQIIGRARLFITTYHITSQKKTESGVEVRIKAVVDRAKIRTRLGQLGVIAGAAPDSAAPAARPELALVVAARIAGTTTATFGQHQAGFVASSLAESFKARGFDVASTAGLPLQVSAGAEAGLPASDSAAIELCQRVGAGGAIIAGIQSEARGRIRGTLLFGAIATVRVRALDAASGDVVTTLEAQGVGFGAGAEDAATRAARDGIARAVRQLGRALAQYWPPPAVADNALLVTVRGASTWRTIGAVIHQLEGTPGIDNVTPRQFSRGRAVLAVSTRIGARRVAAAARAASIPGSSAAIRIEGDAIYVDIADDGS